MPDQKITGMPVKGVSEKDDIFILVDPDDTSQAPTGTNKQMTRNTIMAGVAKRVQNFSGYIFIPAQSNTISDQVQAGDIILGVGTLFSGDFIIAQATVDNANSDAQFAIIFRGQP